MIHYVRDIYGFTSNTNPRTTYLKAKLSLVSKSKRAREIFELVESSRHVIDVVIGPSVGQESAFRGAVGSEPNSKLIWDATVDFPILVDAKQVSKVSFGRTITKTVAKLAPLPAEIVLIHELGHAAQYISELPTYRALFASGTVGIAQIEADNLLRNEWPICDDYGMRRRSSYLHYRGSNETARWTIQ